MQSELKAENPDLNIEILGINRASDIAYNHLVSATCSLPWLQDTDQALVAERWHVVHRDVVVLDSQNQVHAIYNLTQHDLAEPTNRVALKQLFLEAARAADSDQDSLTDDWELKYFGYLSAKPTDDPDGDGVDNATEFAFGTDPKDPKSRSSFRPNVLSSGGQSFLSLTFRRRAGARVSYSVEASPDLSLWSASNSEVGQGPPKTLFDGTGTSEVTYSLKKPISAQPLSFLRVKALPKQPQP